YLRASAISNLFRRNTWVVVDAALGEVDKHGSACWRCELVLYKSSGEHKLSVLENFKDRTRRVGDRTVRKSQQTSADCHLGRINLAIKQLQILQRSGAPDQVHECVDA